MPESSVISRMDRKPRELNQGGTGTTEIVFSENATDPVVLPMPSPTLDLLTTGDSTILNRKTSLINVRAWGRVKTNISTTYVPQLQWGTSLTPGSNTDIESASAVDANSTDSFWFIEAQLMVAAASTTTANIDGCSRFMVSGSTRTFTDWAAIDNEITGVSLTSQTLQGFVVTGTFGTGGAGNAAYLDGFEMTK